VYLKWIFERISILNLLQFCEHVLNAFLSALLVVLRGDRDGMEQVWALQRLMVYPQHCEEDSNTALTGGERW
jgi:hypothetical protein